MPYPTELRAGREGVTSVNGGNGPAVQVDAGDVGAVGDVNGQTGPSVNIDAASVNAIQTVNGKSGTVISLTPADIGAVQTVNGIPGPNVVLPEGGTGTVESVNGDPGPAVVLDAADVGAIASVNGDTGPAVTITADDLQAIKATGVQLITPTTATTYATLELAIADANAGDHVHLGPGSYDIGDGTGVLAIPDNVAIVSGGANGQAVINGQLTLGTNARVFGVNMNVPAGGVGITYAGNVYAAIQNVNFTGTPTSTGIAVTAAPTGNLFFDTIGLYGPLETMLLVSSGACNGTNIFAPLGALTRMIDIVGGKLTLLESSIGDNVSVGVVLRLGAGTAHLFDCEWTKGNIAIQVVADGHTLQAKGCQFMPVDTLSGLSVDILPGVTSGDFIVSSCTIQESLVSNSADYLQNANIQLDFLDPEPGEPSYKFARELSVGLTGKGYEAIFGEGDSTTRGMVVQYNDNGTAGAWTDITSLVKSADGSSGTLFDAAALVSGTGHAVYFGGDAPFYNIKTETSAILDADVSAFSWEYFDGDGWTQIKAMATQSVAPYAQFANAVFGRTGSEHIRFGPIPENWVTLELNGSTKYWIRMIFEGTPLALPAADKIKLGPNRSEINADGFIERFGRGEREYTFPVNNRIFTDADGKNVSNEDIFISTNVDLNEIDNEFQNNADAGRAAKIFIPFGLDTSRPVFFDLYFAVNGGNTGNCDLEFFYTAPFRVGDVLNGTIAEIAIPRSIEIAVPSNDVLQLTTFEMDLSGALPGDLVGISLIRNAATTPDTLPNGVYIIDIVVRGTTWIA